MTALPLVTFPREEFLSRRWQYNKGQHVTVIGPTGCGKTYLCWQLLERTAGRHMPAIVLVKKPRDPLISKNAKTFGYRVTQHWPVPLSLWKNNDPPGYVVWPRTNFNAPVQLDRAQKADVFRRAIMQTYRGGGRFKKRPRILYIDDAYGISQILDLHEELIEFWTEGRSMDGGAWTSFQKPSHVPLWAYSQAEHLFLFNDPDRRSRERFAEIGGVDPETVRDTVMELGTHQALYIRRGGRRMCIVDP